MTEIIIHIYDVALNKNDNLLNIITKKTVNTRLINDYWLID